jgi:hypothetical protein
MYPGKPEMTGVTNNQAKFSNRLHPLVLANDVAHVTRLLSNELPLHKDLSRHFDLGKTSFV